MVDYPIKQEHKKGVSTHNRYVDKVSSGQGLSIVLWNVNTRVTVVSSLFHQCIWIGHPHMHEALQRLRVIKPLLSYSFAFFPPMCIPVK